MNGDHKKTVLRMIPYGIYVLTAKGGDGTIRTAAVNWVTILEMKDLGEKVFYGG